MVEKIFPLAKLTFKGFTDAIGDYSKSLIRFRDMIILAYMRTPEYNDFRKRERKRMRELVNDYSYIRDKLIKRDKDGVMVELFIADNMTEDEIKAALDWSAVLNGESPVSYPPLYYKLFTVNPEMVDTIKHLLGDKNAQ